MSSALLRSIAKPPHDFEPIPAEAVENSLVTFIEHTVKRYPECIAIRDRGQEISYEELNRTANAVAHLIIERYGRGSEPIVFVLGHESKALIVLLAILKSGRPYLPLSLEYPLGRMKAIISESDAPLILTDKKNLLLVKESLQGIHGVDLLNIDEMQWNEKWDNLGIIVDPAEPACILYTSGSTGEPKGVVMSHRSVVFQAITDINSIYCSRTDRMALLNVINFTASRPPIFDSWFVGAMVCIYDIRSDGIMGIPRWLSSENITIFFSTTPVFRTVFSIVPQDTVFSWLRLVWVTGDVVYASNFDLFRKHTSPDCVFRNSLGSSEAGLVAMNLLGHDARFQEGEVVPIGYPVSGKEVILIDANDQRVADGEIGEIVVRSKFLASGYWKSPTLTKEKFQIDPDQPGVQIYHTGDLGRMNKEGMLEHLGRKDNQVKIRGYRVDISEIEKRLYEHPGIGNAIVATRLENHLSSERQLVGYIVHRFGVTITDPELRQYLALKLPSYMIPSFFVFMDSLPLNANGKIDKNALPDVDPREDLDVLDLPANETEERLLGIWKKVLHLGRIGVRDGFFELGGDSLLAVQLLLAIEKNFSKRMPLAIISKASTIRQQAEMLLNGNISDYASVLIPIQPYGHKRPLFCIGGIGGNPIRFHQLLKHFDDEQPVYFLRSRGFESGEQIMAEVEEIAFDYLQEVKKIQSTGPYYFLGESSGGLVAYEIAQQLQDQGEKIAFVGMLDTYLDEIKDAKLALYPYLRMMIQKHIQTIAEGGLAGLRVYMSYYVDLWKYKISEMWEERKRKILLSKNGKASNAFLQVERANLAASFAYTPKPYHGNVIMFSATRQLQFQGRGQDHGWKQIVTGELLIFSLDCYHGNILFEPFVRQVAEKLNQYLDRD